MLSFQNDFLTNIELVRERLMSADPGWGKYKSFLVRDPKLRVINAAALSERIMHHAIMNILEPVFERFQVFHSYACRKGKGTHAAVLHAFRQTKKFGFYLKLDVRKYFDSIDHRILMRQITRLIKDEQVLLLFHGIINCNNNNPNNQNNNIGFRVVRPVSSICESWQPVFFSPTLSENL